MGILHYITYEECHDLLEALTLVGFLEAFLSYCSSPQQVGCHFSKEGMESQLDRLQLFWDCILLSALLLL